MDVWNTIAGIAVSFIPLILSAVGSIAFLWGMHWVLIGRNAEIGNDRKFPRQLVMLGLSLLSIVIIVLTIPISEGSRNQLIGLIGLLISGIFALSSATVVSNLMAGLMLRITKPFHPGDFIKVGDYFGRVAGQGLFDTEVQAENRELIAVPNTYLITNPVSTVRSSGAIIAVSLSLGYDTHHSLIESLLIKAANKSGLNDAFVHIMEIGDFSVNYRVSGVLMDVKGLITARSNLNKAVLDTLHENGIEIMSPAFMNQRRFSEAHSTIPVRPKEGPEEKQTAAEDIVFDKAENAARIEKEKQQLMLNIRQTQGTIENEPDEDVKRALREELEKSSERLKELESLEDESSEEHVE